VNLVPVLTDNSISISSVPSLSVVSETDCEKEDKHEEHESSNPGGSKRKKPSPLRRSVSLNTGTSLSAGPEVNTHKLVDTVLVQIGTPDHQGWVRKKGGHFSTWKSRYLVLKGAHLYWLRTDSSEVCITWLVGVYSIPSCLTRKSLRLRDMSTLLAIELFQTRPLGHMGSNYCVDRIAPTFLARMTKRWSANG
jgi:hypothetical protein